MKKSFKIQHPNSREAARLKLQEIVRGTGSARSQLKNTPGEGTGPTGEDIFRAIPL
jgi:hypothetical protein